MHQRKAFDPEAAAAGGETIARGQSVDAKARKKRVRRRTKQPRRTNAAFEFPVQTLIPPASMLLLVLLVFGMLWIRVLWKIAPKSNQAAQAAQQQQQQEQPPAVFGLESEGAPSCFEHDPGSSSDIDTTLVTQLSDDRLWMMKHHCERYGAAMSIAVYSNSTPDEIATELVRMGCRVAGRNDNGGPVRRDDDETDDENRELDDDRIGESDHGDAVLVTVAVLDAKTHGSRKDYPVNELRNLALGGVETTHVTYIDVDFWPSEGLYETILSPPVRKRLFEDPKLALVIPAFQLNRRSDCLDETVDCRDEHVPKMPKTTDELRKMMVVSREVTFFDPTNVGGHGSTNYKHWFDHQLHPPDHDETSLLHEIPCLKSHRYEPFLTFRYCRELTPPFQEVFSGYGKNKMTWTMQVVASGFVFSQLGGAYLIHYPHAISESREDWNRAPDELKQKAGNGNYNVRRPKKSDGDLGFERFHRGKVDDLYIRFKRWLRETIPEETTRLKLCDSAQDDDGKLWIDPDRKQHWKTPKK